MICWRLLIYSAYRLILVETLLLEEYTMDNMIEYKLYFGLNIDGKPRIDPDEVKQLIQNYFTIYAIDGYTLQTCTGCWQNVPEQTVILTLCTSALDSAFIAHIEKSLRTLSKDYCGAYNQDCVLLTKQEIQAEFIGGEWWKAN